MLTPEAVAGPTRGPAALKEGGAMTIRDTDISRCISLDDGTKIAVRIQLHPALLLETGDRQHD